MNFLAFASFDEFFMLYVAIELMHEVNNDVANGKCLQKGLFNAARRLIVVMNGRLSINK